MPIMIKRRDIFFGTHGSVTNCPVARAIRRTLLVDGVTVHAPRGEFVVDYTGMRYTLPYAVNQWILDYDAGDPVRHGLIFHLDIAPTPVPV